VEADIAGKIFWFTGQPGAGKTTLATALKTWLERRGYTVVHYDGDELRQVADNRDYSEAGRRQNLRLAQWLCLKASEAGAVALASFVSPYRDLREELKARAQVVEVYVHTMEPRGREAHFVTGYEPPLADFIDVDTTATLVEASLRQLVMAAKVPGYRVLREGSPAARGEWALFIGRWQPWHDGHRWLVQQALTAGKKVVVGVRDVPPGEHRLQPSGLTVGEIEKDLAAEVAAGRVKVLVVPDIESVNFGRGVGYSIIEHFPPPGIAAVSGTQLRALRRGSATA
jgi:adenylylsulfate kinase